MAHPKRAEMAQALGSQLAAEVVYDQCNDRWDTGRRAWLACDPTATHAVVVQDDAIAPQGFREALSAALRVVGDNPVGLYVGTVRPAGSYMAAMVGHAKATKASWVVGDGPLWGVGIALPTHMVAPMLEWCDRKPHIAAYDRRMGAYFKEMGLPCWYPMPSLVDHRDEPSLVQKGRSVKRRARFFLPDPSGVDWSRLPHMTGQKYLTYTGPAARRFHRCLTCGFYTPMKHSILQHVRECDDAEARMAHA